MTGLPVRTAARRARHRRPVSGRVAGLLIAVAGLPVLAVGAAGSPARVWDRCRNGITALLAGDLPGIDLVRGLTGGLLWLIWTVIVLVAGGKVIGLAAGRRPADLPGRTAARRLVAGPTVPPMSTRPVPEAAVGGSPTRTAREPAGFVPDISMFTAGSIPAADAVSQPARPAADRPNPAVQRVRPPVHRRPAGLDPDRPLPTDPSGAGRSPSATGLGRAAPPPRFPDHAPPATAAGGVELPSGACVGAGLTAAVLAAAMTVARPRRRVTPRLPGRPAGRPPSGQLVGALRRALPGRAVWSVADAPVADDRIEVGIGGDGRSVRIDLMGTGGLGLSGPGSAGAVRAVLAAVLADHQLTGAVHNRVILSAPTVRRLALGGHTDYPDLIVAASDDAALSHLEAEIAHRTWLADEAPATSGDITSRAGLRAAHPDESLPDVLLVTAADPGAIGPRLAGILAQGRRLGITAVILGGWPSGADGTVSADGTVLAAAGSVRALRRLYTLPAADTAQLLDLLTAAHGGAHTLPSRGHTTPPAPGPAPPAPADATGAHPLAAAVPAVSPADPDAGRQIGDTDDEDANRTPPIMNLPLAPLPPRPAAASAGGSRLPVAGGPRPDAVPDTAVTNPTGGGGPALPPPLVGPPATAVSDRPTRGSLPNTIGVTPAGTGGSPRPPHASDHAAASGPTRPSPAGIPPGEPMTGPPRAPLVAIRLFGPPTVLVAGTPIRTGLRSLGVQLLAYLALHRDGAPTGTILAEILPDVPPRKARNQLYTVVGSLRAATGYDRTWFITTIRGGYQLDPALVDVDLWRFRDALADAVDPDRRAVALARAVAAVGRQPFLAGTVYEWADTYITTVHHQLLDALARLADSHLPDWPDHALDLLGHALSIDPYAEPTYQQIMKIEAGRRHPDAVHRTYQLLRRRLRELDADPHPSTDHLLSRLTAPLPPPRRPRPAR